jgi:hypothetical protein
LFGFGYQVFNPGYLTLDSDDYLLLAQNIWEFGVPYSGYINPSEPLNTLGNKGLFASRPILYSLFLLITGSVKFSPLMALFIQNILSVLSIKKIEQVVIKHGFNINYNIATLGILLFPSLWIYANWIMSETLFMFLVTYWISAYINKKYLLSSVFLTLAFITKPAIMFLMLVWVALYMYRFFKKPKKSLLFSALLPVIFWVLQIAANYTYTGTPITSSMPGINLVQYNAKFTLSKTFGMDSAQKWVNKIDSIGYTKEKEEGFPVSYHYKKNEAQKVIKDHLSSYIMLHLKGSLRWTIDPGRFDLLNFFNIYHEGGNEGWTKTYYSLGINGLYKRALTENRALLFAIILITTWNIFRLILFALNAKVVFSKRTLFFVFLVVLLYFAAISGPVASARFLLPVFPIIWAWISIKQKIT